MTNNSPNNGQPQRKMLVGLWVIVLTVSSAVCSLPQSAAGINAKSDVVWSYNERTSWLDCGFKALVFPDGHGFILRSKGPGKPEVWSLMLSPDECKAVYRVCNRNYFFELPSEIRTCKTDGSDVDIFLTDNGISKEVRTYMSDNIMFNRISRTIETLLEQKAAVSKPVSLDRFVSDCKDSIQKLKGKSRQFLCAKQFVDDLYVNYYAYGDKAKDVITILAGLLSEEPNVVIRQRFQNRIGTRASSPRQLTQLDGTTAMKMYKELEKEAKHFIYTKALTGSRENKSKSLLESLSAWWASEVALKKGLLPFVVLPPGDKANPKLHTAGSFLFSYSIPWLEQALDYSINREDDKAKLCLKAADTAAEGASCVLEGKLPANAQEYYFEEEQGKVIAKKRESDWRSPSHPFFKCPGYLPADVYVR